MERNTIELTTHTAIRIDETGVHNKVSAASIIIIFLFQGIDRGYLLIDMYVRFLARDHIRVMIVLVDDHR
jgi:hypothetical protein